MHRLFHLLTPETRRPEVLVVIFGVHSLDWMMALAPTAPAWRLIAGVRGVLHFSSAQRRVPLARRWGRRTVVVPLMETHIATRPARHRALVPNLEALSTLGDKQRFSDYVRSRGLSHLCPKDYRSIEEAEYPCVIKRTNLNGGAGIEMAATLEQARLIVKGPLFEGHPFIIQKRVRMDVEYVVHCVCLKGRVIWHKVYAYEAPCGFRGATIPVHLLGELEGLLLPLDYSGPCNVDCTWDAGGRLTIFEINPRLGGSLMRADTTADLAACLSVIIAAAGGKAPGELSPGASDGSSRAGFATASAAPDAHGRARATDH